MHRERAWRRSNDRAPSDSRARFRGAIDDIMRVRIPAVWAQLATRIWDGGYVMRRTPEVEADGERTTSIARVTGGPAGPHHRRGRDIGLGMFQAAVMNS